MPSTTIESLFASRRRLTRLALVLGALSVLISITVGVIAFRGSRATLVDRLTRDAEILARSVRMHGEQLAAQGQDLDAALRTAWDGTRGSESGLYLCFIGDHETVEINTAHGDRVGVDVGSMQASESTEGSTVVRDLLRERRSWAGENVDLQGVPQVVAFSFSEPMKGLVTVHVPEEVISARVMSALWPLGMGIGFVSLVLLPLSLALLHRAYRRSEDELATVIARREREAEEAARSKRLEAVGRLAASVAHDFNNLLTVIKTSSSLMLDGDLDDVTRQDVEQILSTTDRAATIVRQLLDYARPASHTMRRIALCDLVGSMETVLRRLCGREIEIELTLDHTEIFVMADAGQLERMIANLVANARDASRKGDRIHLEVTSEDDARGDGGWARLVVRDEGEGMSPDVRDKMFEPFFTTKHAAVGHGLGLATAQGIVEQHGGTLAVDSELGVGTTVTISLPQVSAPDEAATAAVPTGGSERIAAPSRILLVDDEPSVRRALHATLRADGHDVTGAADAKEARAKFHEAGVGEFSIVITDVSMPGEDGVSLARALLETDRRLVVLLISGNADEDVLSELDEARADFLRKPFSSTELAEALARLTAPSGAAAIPAMGAGIAATTG